MTEKGIYDPSWCIEYCKAYAEQLRDKTRANRAEHAAQCIEYLLSLVQKEWVGLTDEEIRNIATQGRTDFSRPAYEEYYIAIEQALKEKNT